MSEPLQTLAIKTNTVYQDLSGLPFSREVSNTLASLDTTSNAVRPVLPKFERISDNHGRSMTESTSSKAVVWGGELSGDVYGARTIKGTAMVVENLPTRLKKNSDPDYKVKGYGLMDDSIVPRIIKASELMRKNGLPTERPTAVKKIEEVCIKDDKGSWRIIPIKNWEQNELRAIENEEPYLEDKPMIEDAKRYLKETDFVALERDVQVDERVKDLLDAIDKGKLRETIIPILKWLNVATQIKKEGLINNTPKPEKFDYTDEDILKYLGEYLPSQIGTYLVKFHKLGLVHGYLHSQNWSAVGTMYDLDSVYGKSLFNDDDPQTDEDVIGDIIDSEASIFIPVFNFIKSSEFKNTKNALEEANEAKKIFLKSYFIEKYGPNVSRQNLTKVEMDYINDTGLFLNTDISSEIFKST